MSDQPQETSQNVPSLINSGIIFEERFIQTLTDDIKNIQAFKELDEAEKTKILMNLKILKDESIEHEIKLKEISDKY
jgi:hypothetical protein